MPSDCMRRGDLRAQRLGGAAARLGQATAPPPDTSRSMRSERAFAFGEALLGALERADFLHGPRELRGQLHDALAVLARERLERRGLALDLLLARRVHVERIEIVPQRIRGLAHENGGLAEQLRRRPSFGSISTTARSAPRALPSRSCALALSSSYTALSAPLAACASRPRPAMRFCSANSASISAAVVTSPLQLGELVAQQLEPRLAVLGGRAQRLEFGAAGAVATVQIGHGGRALPARRAHRGARAARCASPGAGAPAGRGSR